MIISDLEHPRLKGLTECQDCHKIIELISGDSGEGYECPSCGYCDLLYTDVLEINPHYYNAIPRPTKERYNEIKEDILKYKQHVSIIINDDRVILDGHTRYQIYLENGLELITEKKYFDSELEEERWVYSLNLNRRDLSTFTQIELRLKLKEIDIELAKENQSKGGEGYRICDKVDVNKQVAKSTKKDPGTVSRVRQILEKSDEDTIKNLRNGKDGVSINKVYKNLKKIEKKEKRKAEIQKIQVNLPDTIQLYNMDFQKAPIKDNIVSLIFTDPPYLKEFLYLYEQLAVFAARVLRDGGSLITYVPQASIPEICAWMKEAGLTYWWPISVKHSGPSATIWDKKVLVAGKIMLWFTKGKYEGEFVRDFIDSEYQGKGDHPWQQSTIESNYYIEFMTIPNDIICDPFLGSGKFGESAKMLKRQFIGCEIDKEHYDNARRIISNAT